MIVCKGGTQQGTASRRFARVIHLGEALRELMNLYSRLGRVHDAVVTQIERDIEGCLGHPNAERGAVQNRLGILYRVRDLHRFVMTPPTWTILRHRVLETMLFHPTPETRWVALRELLVEDILRPGSVGAGEDNGSLLESGIDPESFKLAVSDRHGPLGSLLTTIALFNLDAVEEALPDNLLLRLSPGRFPRHTWEVLVGKGLSTKTGILGAWQPATPLCRYEYLAADLLHALLRRSGAALQDQTVAGWPQAATESPMGDAGTSAGKKHGLLSGPVTCRLESGRDDPEGTQLELLPLEPRAFPAELLRLAHRRHGPEGTRLLAMMLGHLHKRGPEAATVLRLGEIAAGAALHDLSTRGVQTRLRRLRKIIGLLEGVELTRYREREGRTYVQRNRLLTVLGTTEEQHRAEIPATGRKASPSRQGARTEPAEASLNELPPTEMVVATDSLMHGAPAPGSNTGPGLAARFGNLPQSVVDLAGKSHPSLLPLYVFLRGRWSGREQGARTAADMHAQSPEALEFSATALLHEAGIWVSETGRYRALEALRRDLDTLVEHGWLGGWRMRRNQGRGAVRDAMEDRIVLIPPGTEAGRDKPGSGRLPVEMLGG